MSIQKIVINKNRGWRGLAEIICLDEENKEVNKNIFSFSQHLWDYLVRARIVVVQDTDNYHVIKFDDIGRLPSPTQQRSVLIKNYIGNVTEVNSYAKDSWTNAEGDDWCAINAFRKNRNNHTTSDWNCIGIRVMPSL